MSEPRYEKNVFLNCPFDDEYVDILRPIMFTILYLGYCPRIATERSDSGEPRISKITELIRDCQFGIHDLSRIRASEVGELYRFNMPFELGMDYACRCYKGGKWSRKKCLILETERYRYQAAISDLSNSDIKAHGDKPDEAVKHVRNWLVQEDLGTGPSPTTIWYGFNDFMADLYVRLVGKGFSRQDIEELPITELLDHMRQWIGAPPARPSSASNRPHRRRSR